MPLTATTETDEAVEWAIRTLNADAPLTGAIASGAAWRTLPRTVDTKDAPGVTVGWQSARPPTGAVRSGSRTYSEVTVILWVKATQQGRALTRQQLKAVIGQIIAVLDGRKGEALPNGGELIECLYLQSLPDNEEPLGDVTRLTLTVWFQTSLKCLS